MFNSVCDLIQKKTPMNVEVPFSSQQGREHVLQMKKDADRKWVKNEGNTGI